MLASLSLCACGADDRAPLGAATYTRVAGDGRSFDCPVCPIAIAKQAAGEPVATLCTEHCENCGNGICDLDEDPGSCASDCHVSTPPGGPGPGNGCGNGFCSSGEEFSCPQDCGPVPPIE